MELRDVRHLFAYDEWANARFVEVLAALPEARLTDEIPSSFPSLLGTLTHIVAAEWVWLRRFLGESPTAFPDWLTTQSLARTRAELAAVEAERAAFLEALEAADLRRPVAYRTLAGVAQSDPLDYLLAHVVNHSTYHRGQLATMLRQLGVAPPATDLVLYQRIGPEAR